MKIRKDILSLAIALLSLVAGVILLVAKVSPLWLLLPGVVLVASVIALFVAKQKNNNEAIPDFDDADADDDEGAKWPFVVAWILTVLCGLAIIVTAIFAGWWALVPAILFFGALTWLLHLYEKKLFWIPLVGIVIALILLGVFAMLGDLGEVHIDKAVIEQAVIEDATVENETVNTQDVDTQNVEDQTVENQSVNNAEVENQTVNNQTVNNQTVENQTVENQTVNNQTVENQKVNNQTVNNQTVNNQKPTTQAPTTQAPTTQAPTTQAPTTQAPTTQAPETTKPQAPETTKPQAPETTKPSIKCSSSIRYGETLYVSLEGISASNIKVSNRAFVSVEVLSDSRIAITLTEDVDGYITITDTVTGTNRVIDIVA